MPRAVIDTEPQVFELKSCPPDGFIKLRRMTYGEWLHRADITMKIQLELEEKRSRSKGPQLAEVSAKNEAVTMYEFTKCVVDHNLEDASGNKLNFSDRRTLDMIDPRVGNEIGDYINQLHETFTEDDQGNS